jgi:hypothetical protein
MIRYFLIFLLVLILIPNIEGFKTNDFYSVRDIPIDDRIYLPISDENTPDHKHLLSNYLVMYRPEYDHRSGLISNIRDIKGIDSHHYLFESPHLYKPNMESDTKEKIKNEAIDYLQNKSYSGYIDRPITYSDESNNKTIFLNKLQNSDKIITNDPFEYPYRDPNKLSNKIVYDFSNSVDFDLELKEREQRLLGYRRSILNKQNDYTSMTTCMNIDEEGTRYNCHKYGLNYNEDANFRIARDDEHSHSICCKSP